VLLEGLGELNKIQRYGIRTGKLPALDHRTSTIYATVCPYNEIIIMLKTIIKFKLEVIIVP
jgi:hypothetical protein